MFVFSLEKQNNWHFRAQSVVIREEKMDLFVKKK